MISKGNQVKFARFVLLFFQCIMKQLLDLVFVIRLQGYVPLANFKFLWYNSYGVLRQTSTLHLFFLSLFTGQGFLLEKNFSYFPNTSEFPR